MRTLPNATFARSHDDPVHYANTMHDPRYNLQHVESVSEPYLTPYY